MSAVCRQVCPGVAHRRWGGGEADLFEVKPTGKEEPLIFGNFHSTCKTFCGPNGRREERMD